ncbi:MAG: L,D-transpeptidase family protein [Sphingobacteriales bacterium]|jgi:murein L,D-transpeptidase YcbB/YkuD|nr:L,D-transpeptidase family protein [Sphingobacteriales bacterium]
MRLILCFSVISLLLAQSCDSVSKREMPKVKVVSSEAPRFNQKLDSISVKAWLLTDSSLVDDTALLLRVYRERNWEAAWTTPLAWSERAYAVISALESIGVEGVRESFPGLNDLRQRISTGHLPDSGDWKTDIQLSAAFFWYARKTTNAQTVNAANQSAWYLPRFFPDVNRWVDTVTSNPDNVELLDLGRFVQYVRLRKELLRLNRFINTKEWILPDSVLSTSDSISINNSNAVVQRLKVFGDLKGPGPFSEADILEGIQRFRVRHAMPSDGELDSACISELNRSPIELRLQLLVNLERCRWLQAAKAERFLVVNVPDFKLYAFSKGKMEWDMPVVVGEELWPTVSFAGDIKQIVLNPYWVVPLSIIRKELLPKILADKNYLERNEFELIDRNGRSVETRSIPLKDWAVRDLPYRLQQRPGKNNPLGRMKFHFPNNHAVYMHDTPSKGIFSKPYRGFSHGCIRLYDGMKVLRFVMGDSAMRSEQVNKRIASGREHRIPLRLAMPVRIVYFTAWVDSAGVLQIRKDLYGRDAVVAKELIGS